MAKKKQLQWSDTVGHAVIVTASPDYPNPRVRGQREYIVDRLSPSGDSIKFETNNGSFFWASRDEYTLIEDLGEPR